MLFNSLEYLIFFPLVFAIYWYVLNNNTRGQNIFLLLMSYLFYGWWDYRFLGLIAFSSILDYYLAKGIEHSKEDGKRKTLLTISVLANLGVLGFFKYFNFFAENLQSIFAQVGYELDPLTLNIILPVGISFYTFQTMSYTIDVYRGDIKASKDPIAFFCYVSFFPQLVAGPIERAKNLLPQFSITRKFTYDKGLDGCRQILIGFFKKVVIADNCAYLLNPVFDNFEAYNATSLILAAILFSFQIYGDFSGYSDIAIGTSRVLGINLNQNFRTPYFSRSIAEFWRRWHISLSSWFKDYLYLPLGGSRLGKWMSIRNVIIIFVVSGFWHGANWTFIFWGLLNALLIIPSFLQKKNRNYTSDIESSVSLHDIYRILSTFLVTTIAWVLFRSESMEKAIGYYISIFENKGASSILIDDQLWNFTNFHFTGLVLGIIFILTLEWKNRTRQHGLAKMSRHRLLRYSTYCIMTHFIIKNFFSDEPFIYFQF